MQLFVIMQALREQGLVCTQEARACVCVWGGGGQASRGRGVQHTYIKLFMYTCIRHAGHRRRGTLSMPTRWTVSLEGVGWEALSIPTTGEAMMPETRVPCRHVVMPSILPSCHHAVMKGAVK